MMWSAEEDARILTYVTTTVNAIKKHLLQHHPDSHHTKALLAKLHDVKLLEMKSNGRMFNSGGFNHLTGTLLVAPRDGNGRVRSEGSLNKTILHELAHGTRFKHIGEASHSELWQAAFEFFLRVGTEEMGLAVEMNCSAVSFYGVSMETCRRCIWTVAPESCTPFTGPPKL